MNYSPTEKLHITKCVIGNVNLVSGPWFNGLDSPNTSISTGAGAAAVFNGFLNNSTKYFMYLINDTTTTRRTTVVKLILNVVYSDLSIQSFELLVPTNVFIRVHVPPSFLSIPAGQTITEITLNSTTPSSPTLIDAFVEAEYRI